MQSIRLKIAGDFWDSQIYRGRLYLWRTSGSLAIYRWDELVESLCADETRLALTCGFARGDYLYGPEFEVVFGDVDVGDLVAKKFADVSSVPFEIGARELGGFLVKEIKTPFQTLHDDCDVYGNRIFGLTEKGLYALHINHTKRRGPISGNDKLWDGQGNSVRAKSGTLAIAAGADGLLEGAAFPTTTDGDSDDVKVVSERHTLFANWAFASIVGSSDIGDSYLAAYTWERKTQAELNETGGLRSQFKRRFEGLIDDTRIFGRSGLAWGAEDKLYSVSDGRLEVVRFTQKKLGNDADLDAFEHLAAIDLAPWKGDVISGGVSFFGAIVELENAIVIVGSNNESETIAGPISRWRVFPRSKRYENHLHLIYTDHLEIRSYNHDYFVNQKEKRAGITHRTDSIRF
jgi:hypothetical protein